MWHDFDFLSVRKHVRNSVKAGIHRSSASLGKGPKLIYLKTYGQDITFLDLHKSMLNYRFKFLIKTGVKQFSHNAREES